jgi:hypothetical protein
MKQPKVIRGLTILSVIILLVSTFSGWMVGEPTGNMTKTQQGNNIRVSVEFESINLWREIATGLAPGCILSTLGLKWSLMPLVVPIAILFVIFLILLPWRKRPVLKRDGLLLVGLGVLLVASLWSWVPTCPQEIVSRWRYAGGAGQPVLFLGVLLLMISGALILFNKPAKDTIQPDRN